jgi:predicted acetyltransferase
MMSEELVIIAPDRRKHTEAIYDLFGKAFRGGGYWNMVEAARRYYFERSHYDWNTSRIGLIGEKLVTHFGVWDFQMRIGTGRVRSGGIGSVMTHGACRRRGHMAATARATVKAMTQNGYDLSILFGLHNFYHRFGYVRAWAPTDYFVKAEEIHQNLPAGENAVRMRKFAPDQRADLDALYNRHFAPFVGTAVRPTYRGRVWSKNREVGYLWTNTRGKVEGYIIVRKKERTLICLEAVGGLERMLAALSKLLRRWAIDEVRFDRLPYDHPLAKWMRRGTSRTETRYVRSGSAMIRTTNLRSTLTRISRELSRRMKTSLMNRWKGELVISDKREKVTLRIDRSNVKVADRPVRGRAKNTIKGGEEIAQLLIGTHSPAEIVESGRTRVTGDAKDLIGILFPEKHPVLSAWDYF